MSDVRLTMLNSMAGADFEAALDQHVAWGLRDLDLRDAIAGKWLGDLTVDEARVAAEQIAARRLRVHCLSSKVFDADLQLGEAVFRGEHLAALAHVLDLARILRPRFVRLVAAQDGARVPGDGVDAVLARHPWALDVYREGIDAIAAAGFEATIENEARGCIIAATGDFTRFFERLDRPGRVALTWDVHNQWATGHFPTLADYDALRPLLGYVHLKGGRAGADGETLELNVALDETSFDVLGITERVVRDGVSPVLCLNAPGHGRDVDGYDYAAVTARDLVHLRTRVEGVAW
ncbi:MAG TPA: hypothetical protein VNS09_15855 [Solirubrobacter sp.]|nr:hypothetical protein [Solirubrobacter sp.]